MRTVYLKTTETCNLNCDHCFTSGRRGQKIFWDMQKVADWITRFMDHLPIDETVHFEFHGGEPMLADINQLELVLTLLRGYGKRVSVGIATNLVYKLTDDKLSFLQKLDAISTSWDVGIRFENNKQKDLWYANVKKLVDVGIDVRLNISVSKQLMQMDIGMVLSWVKHLGVATLAFERITDDGNASQTSQVPLNTDVDSWYVRLHEVSELMGARQWFHNTLLEEVYAKFEKNQSACGTFCRDCEEKIFTINATGTISGCPNSAPTEHYATIDDSMQQLFSNSNRIFRIVQEKHRNPKCYSCDVFQYCGSGCHQLSWDGEICPAPKTLMRSLIPGSKRVIPILTA